MRPIKLLRITTVPFSIITLLKGQVRYMHKRGIDVKMVSAADESVDRAVAQEGVPHLPVPLSRKFNPVSDLWSVWKLWLLFRRERPDIIHVNTAKAGLLANLAGWLASVPLRIYTVGGFKFQSNAYSPKKRAFMRWVEKSIYYFATDVWPNNPTLLKEIKRLGLAPDHKIHMIGHGATNGVDLDVFQAGKTDPKTIVTIKQKVDWQPAHRYLLFVGRLCGDKGITELVGVFQRLKKEFPALHLLLVGPLENFDDPLPVATVSAIERETDIHALGWSDQIPAYLELADYFVFPSHREGLPNVVMQAGAMKLPVVCSDILGNNDLIDHGRTGVLFQKGNEADFYQKLRAAIKNEYPLEEYAASLYQEITERYDRRVIHRLIYEKYLDLISKKELR